MKSQLEIFKQKSLLNTQKDKQFHDRLANLNRESVSERDRNMGPNQIQDIINEQNIESNEEIFELPVIQPLFKLCKLTLTYRSKKYFMGSSLELQKSSLLNQ